MGYESSLLSCVFFLLFFYSPLLLYSHGVPSPINLQGLSALSFEDGYTQLFGDSNLMLLRDGKTVHILLDERTGAGFASQDLYLYGFFSASIKLPSDYAAGVVVAFYMSNGDVFEKNHDELDFEFLGNIRGREWRVQTNVYGNGSTGFGREERYGLWFDPTEDFHNYSILWSKNRILFYIDNVPIREVVRTEAMGGHFPSKPMSLYATIWDGSNWATSGGRYKVNYKYAPYIAEFTDLILHGCAVDPIDHLSTCRGNETELYDFTTVTSEQFYAMKKLRRKHMTYSYCYDGERYPATPAECSVDSHEAEQFEGAGSGRSGHRRRRGKNHHRAVKTMAIAMASKEMTLF
ncbi:probable xyloglucan endotransglucosylase/hydrolase protein 28 [Phalaenopsis equestris]|uniref:probable xyloglucan endotransglucosylase/hydrolase protein 28 n=1 Tax=Phalaenopsis equestris TaxID=78828 RepID=UPI0009E55CD9|nr:probable xyloglucan endotransglucosylase/hydrolase protein 28 [Phalaenopsis equestris]